MAIISRLLTNHIELNLFLHIFQMKDTNGEIVDSPICDQCQTGANESVEHFLMHCPSYHEQRQMLMNELQQIWPGYNNPFHQTLRNILLPFLIVDRSMTDKYNRCPITTASQAEIWKHICRFVKRTRRLKDLYRVDMTKLT